MLLTPPSCPCGSFAGPWPSAFLRSWRPGLASSPPQHSGHPLRCLSDGSSGGRLSLAYCCSLAQLVGGPLRQPWLGSCLQSGCFPRDERSAVSKPAASRRTRGHVLAHLPVDLDDARLAR